MFKRSTIFLGLMLTGSLAAAALVSGDDTSVVAPVVSSKSVRHDATAVRAALPILHLEKLARIDTGEPEQDPFTGKSWYIPPPPPPPQKIVIQDAPAPTAPPLPFRYMGRMQQEGETTVVYLTQGSRAYSVSKGDMIDGVYRLETVAANRLILTYLPLDIKQTLNLDGAAELEMDRFANTDNGFQEAHAGDLPP